MREITLGELIEKLRIKKNISRMRLSDGVCSVRALARYEKDERVSDKFLDKELLKKI